MKLNFDRRSLGRKVFFLSLLSAMGLVVWLVGSPLFSNATAQGSHKQASPEQTGEFVPVIGQQDAYVIREANGQSVCREATPADLSRMQEQRTQQTELHVIYGGSEDVNRLQQAQLGLRITLRATTQLDGFPEAKAAFIRAAQNWESRILSPISIIIDVDYGTTFFGVEYTSTNIIGQASSARVGGATGYSTFRQALINGASSSAEAALLGALPAGQLPTDQGALTAVFTNIPVFRALGIIPANANPDTEPSPFNNVPRIGFNSRFPFDFDPTDGIAANRVDFDGVATHEIGHVLGFSSSVGEKELDNTLAASLTILDFFRFRPGVTLNTFPTAERILASGGAHNFFAGGAELGFSTGRPDGNGGDEEQASHWKADEVTGVYIGVMDPTAARGDREEITANDMRAFDTIGYRVRSAQQQIEALPRPLSFGDAALNTNVDRTLTVFNTGGQPLQVTNVTSSNALFSVVSPGTSFSIPANSQQDLVLRFRPTANGAQTAALTLTSNDPNRPTLPVTLSGFGGILPTVALTSGTAQNASMPAPPTATGSDCILDATQYTIQVLNGATQLRVALTGNQDLDLYARFGQRVTGTSQNFVADHVSDSENSSEAFTITPSGSPALRAGTYYVGVANCGPGAASYSVTATTTGGNAALAAVSAASYRGTDLTSESIASAFGANLATATVVATTTLPTTLGGSTLRVRDSAGAERLAPLFFVSAGQINFLVPTGTALGTATITVVSGSGATSEGTINIATLAPGLFAANANARDVAAASALRVLANGSQQFEPVARLDTATNRFVAVPIDLGPSVEQVFLVLFGTGLRNRSALSAVTVQVGGVSASVPFAGAQGSLFGLDQVNVLLPRALIGRGDVDVALTVDGKTANIVRVNIR